MAGAGVAEAFARLSTSDSRLNALEALIKELTPYEWRFVQSRTGFRTFQFDVIGSLPVELVSHIFSYLDTSTPWRLQHVSRSWFQNLRSLVVLKPSIDNWYNGRVSLHGVDLDFCRQKARSIHAFRSASQSALPDSSFKISADFCLKEKVLKGDHLISLAHDRRQVHVLNLRSLTSKTIVPVAREVLRSVCAYDDLVAVTANTGGMIYVAKLTGHGPVKRFRFVTSSSNFVVSCRHRTVACTALLQDGLLVYIWNYDTEQGRSFTIGSSTAIPSGDRLCFPMPIYELGMLPQPYTETVVLCLLIGPLIPTDTSHDDFQLLTYRFTYSGKCINQAKRTLGKQCVRKLSPDWYDLYGIRFTPASRDGLFMLHCKSVVIRFGIEISYTIQFDEKLHALTHLQHPTVHAHEGGLVVWWKDTFVEAGTKDHIIVHRGTTSKPCDYTVQAYSSSGLAPRNLRERQMAWKELLINERYIIRPYCDGVYIYCYDHTVRLPGKEGILDGVGPWRVIEPQFASVRACIAAMDDGM